MVSLCQIPFGLFMLKMTSLFYFLRDIYNKTTKPIFLVVAFCLNLCLFEISISCFDNSVGT